MKFVLGNTNEERFASIDSVLQAIVRKLPKFVITISPPTVISKRVEGPDPDGKIMSEVIPFNCKLIRLVAYAERHSKDAYLRVHVTTMIGMNGARSHTFEGRWDNGRCVVDIDHEVLTGALVEASSSSALGRVYLALAAAPTLNDAERRQHALNIIESLSD